MRLSIIVPVYNGEKYILEALDSYFQQFNSEVEVIVIDDGSTDGTYDIISNNYKCYIETGHLVLQRQENSGVSSARNAALCISKGDYITFLDSDDILQEQYTSSILKAIDLHKPDVVEFGFTMFSNKKEINESKKRFVYDKFGLINFKDVEDDVFLSSIWYPCIRAFKSTLFDNKEFPIGVNFCEDMMLLTNIYSEIEVVYHIKKSLYAYRINEDGATLNIKPDYFDNILNFLLLLPSNKNRTSDYLKIHLSYLLYRCYYGKSLPISVRITFAKLFVKYLFDSKLNIRKKLILGFPNTYRILKKAVNK
ncbi:glycosyltransferase family 2 protein [Aliivibrio sp. S2TY2]|uniref:glycosyltransferase family 2 protein n=1 Tax=unclassified Aliivibrio TaxID=2645654 RepID=UPI00237977EA|nr:MULTISPECIES: glycosyltransferase family 2 protein [unclassified Aliivibrio]MDD9174991.1 glycosyltransferase family 2 protein [Aliivibrio sp. S3TY1]MDD9192062.1 glycosyltransferase family 2 protein [Aliivibrio sp. S2TY2]